MKNGDKEYYLLILYKNILAFNSKVGKVKIKWSLKILKVFEGNEFGSDCNINSSGMLPFIVSI